MKTGIELIAQERHEQIEKHGFSLTVDAEHYQRNELVDAALYALTMDKKHYPESWEFWFHDNLVAKEGRMDETTFAIERLKIAGALIAAEIDRLQEPINNKKNAF
jgi:hypothetical protein